MRPVLAHRRPRGGLRSGLLRGAAGVRIRRSIYRGASASRSPHRGTGDRRRDRRGDAHLGQRVQSAAPTPKTDRDRPAFDLDEATRARILDAAVRLASAANYRGVAPSSSWSATTATCFMEANARLQVEHTVTEEVTGLRPRGPATADRRWRDASQISSIAQADIPEARGGRAAGARKPGEHEPDATRVRAAD